jgi:hypothetical protein
MLIQVCIVLASLGIYFFLIVGLVLQTVVIRFQVNTYRLIFLYPAHCALLLLLKVEKHWPVIDSVAVAEIDAFIISSVYQCC